MNLIESRLERGDIETIFDLCGITLNFKANWSNRCSVKLVPLIGGGFGDWRRSSSRLII